MLSIIPPNPSVPQISPLTRPDDAAAVEAIAATSGANVDRQLSGLGGKTARGFSWLLLQTIFGKVAGIATQIVLGRLLLKEDFAVVSLAYVVTSFAGIVQDAGLSQVLIHRQRHFARWSNIVVWMSLASGVLAGALVALAAPLAAWAYHEPKLLPLLLLLAAATPLNTISVVPGALLQVQMRFKFLAAMQCLFLALTATLTVVLALLHFGAYAIVLPPMLVAVVRACSYWSVARPVVRKTLQLRRWRYVMRDSALILASSFFITITMQADNLILGLLAPKDVLGSYYFGFNLSMQTTVLLTGTLAGVLFPVLSKLQHDPARQSAAFLRAARVVAVIGIPACVLQAAAAGPLLHAIFGTKWDTAIPIIQILSIGSALQIINAPAISLIQAQGRFGLILRITISLSILFVAAVILGAYWGSANGVAIAATCSAALSGVIVPYIALKRMGKTLGDVIMVYALPLAISASGTAVALGGVALLPRPTNTFGFALDAGLVICTASGIYIAAARRLYPEIVTEVRQRLADVRGRARKAAVS